MQSLLLPWRREIFHPFLCNLFLRPVYSPIVGTMFHRSPDLIASIQRQGYKRIIAGMRGGSRELDVLPVGELFCSRSDITVETAQFPDLALKDTYIGGWETYSSAFLVERMQGRVRWRENVGDKRRGGL